MTKTAEELESALLGADIDVPVHLHAAGSMVAAIRSRPPALGPAPNAYSLSGYRSVSSHARGYSIGERYPQGATPRTPSPGRYEVKQRFSENGMKIGEKYEQRSKYQTPGPGAYNVEMRDRPIAKSRLSLRFQLPIVQHPKPSPIDYRPLSLAESLTRRSQSQAAPRSQCTSRSQISSTQNFQADLAQTPGPATAVLEPARPNQVKIRTWFAPLEKMQTPGPYDVRESMKYQSKGIGMPLAVYKARTIQEVLYDRTCRRIKEVQIIGSRRAKVLEQSEKAVKERNHMLERSKPYCTFPTKNSGETHFLMYGSDLYGGVIHGRILLSSMGDRPQLSIDNAGFSKVELNPQLLAWWKPHCGVQILLDELIDHIEQFLNDIINPKEVAASRLLKCETCGADAAQHYERLQEAYAHYVIRFQRQEM